MKKSRNRNRHSKRPQSLSVTIGRNLRFYRKLASLSQKQVADLVGVSYQQMQKYEKGVNRISAEKLFILRSVYNVSMDDFFTNLDVSKNKRINANDSIALDIFKKVSLIEDKDVKKCINKIISLISTEKCQN